MRPVIKVKNSEAGPEWWTICQIAQRMKAQGFDFEGPEEIMEEIAKVVPIYGGVSHRRLEGEAILVARPDPAHPMPIQLLYSDKEYRGLQWPCPDGSHPGTPVLYSEGFPNGGARLIPPAFKKVVPPEQKDYGLMYVPGRVLLQPQREIEVVKGRQNSVDRDELVELSNEDAARLGIEEGDPVLLRTPVQTFEGKGRHPGRAASGYSRVYQLVRPTGGGAASQQRARSHVQCSWTCDNAGQRGKDFS